MADEWMNIMQDVSDDDQPAEDAPLSRQERIRRAFDESKASYKNELVVLHPDWFNVKPEDVLSKVTNDRFGLQNLDSSITDAYLHKNYQLALDLCLVYLDGVRDGSIPLEAASSRDREYYDIALKSCLRLRDTENGSELAKRSQHLWKSHSAVGMAAAQVYLIADNPREAIRTLLSSIPVQVNAHPFLQLLATSFTLWSTESSQARFLGQLPSKKHLDATKSLEDILTGYATRTAVPFYYGISSKSLVVEEGKEKNSITKYTVDQINTLCIDAGFLGEELDALVGLCTAKLSDADEEGAGKSVRAL